jgi:D-glycero-alpha-D-manno-heptose-7-phosphate kinase
VIVRSRAPLRIDFAGGWTDVPVFAAAEGGAVVNAAVDLQVHVEFLLGARGQTIRLHAEDLGEHVTIQSSGAMAYDGRLDLHKAALNMLPVTGGIEILTRSDAPGGSGLGASGALDVALLAGLARMRREPYEPGELAEMGFQLETQELGLLGGRQDQYAAALGSFHELRFDEDGVAVRRLALDEAAARDLERHLLLVYTGHSHFSSGTHAHVWQGYAEGDDDVTAALLALRELVAPAVQALEAGDWQALGDAVDENWRQQQRLHASITTPKIATIEAAARAAGAWGLKATGAGAGGCMVVLCPAAARESVAAAVIGAGAEVLEMAFAFDGVTVWEEEDAAQP